MGHIEDKRTDFCEKVPYLTDGSLSLDRALEGVHLNVITLLYDKAWFDEPIGSTDPALQSGYHVELLRLLSVKAGFTYTIVSVNTSSFSPELSRSSYLELSL
jgi:hypothetical protein